MTRHPARRECEPDVEASVVVPFHNDARHLPALLESLAAQRCAAPWEVITVNNLSSDGSEAVVRQFCRQLQLTVIHAPDRANPSYARNAGARAAGSSKLLFIDADDAVAPGYVAALSAALDRHELVTSRVDSTSLNPSWVRAAHGPPWQEQSIGTFLGFLPATGINIGIRRELFVRLGGFPEEFSGSEDLAFAWAAQLEAGHSFHFVPEAVYQYRYRDSYGGLFRQSTNWGRDHVVLYRRFRTHGMPGRTSAAAARELGVSVAGFLSGGRSQRPAYIVRLGYAWGRLKGSVMYRVFYP